MQAQVLVRWALQHEYLSVPRTSSKSKIERQAFFENSYDGVKDFVLSQEEMNMLDALDEQLPAGRLGITDGWLASDIVDERWDPTLALV
jgi:diketogulonate reductase-like aldo/keto reductase